MTIRLTMTVQNAPLFRVAHALIGQGVFPLKLLAEHLLYLLSLVIFHWTARL